MSARSSSVTTFTRMPSCFRSSWMMVAIWTRSAFSKLVTIVNSTGWPAASTSVPSACHEKPAPCRICRASGTERRGFGSDWFTQSLLPGGTCPHSGVACPR